jgi:uncharacterized protein (DUF1778 family)
MLLLALCATLVHISCMAFETIERRAPARNRSSATGKGVVIQSQIKAKRLNRLVARVSSADKAIISQGAALAGQSVGSFIVSEARKAALQTIESRERIVLNATESRRFIEALLTPPRPLTSRMRKAMQAYKTLVQSDMD